ncbi:hypothetical protein LCGC14_2203430, partial [marine sediment metagenome]
YNILLQQEFDASAKFHAVRLAEVSEAL